MIIYIYGSESFKKDINDVLNHSNIKFRLDEHGEIKDLETLEQLKEAIEDNPNNIYLIDDEKIIKKNSLNQKIKFLQPKDGIEQAYLLDHGIGDISVDSIDELSKHIKKKLEAVITEKESNAIQESIVEMVEDAYEENDDSKEYVQLDEELSELLAHDESDTDLEESVDDFDKEIDFDDSLSSLIDEKESNSEDFSLLKELSFDEDLDNINVEKEPVEEKAIENYIDTIELTQGDNNMADEFSQFDTLNENEILAALEGINDIDTSFSPPLKKTNSPSASSSNKDNIEVNGSNVNDIAELISKLLNNKTLEITIKVKD